MPTFEDELNSFRSQKDEELKSFIREKLKTGAYIGDLEGNVDNIFNRIKSGSIDSTNYPINQPALDSIKNFIGGNYAEYTKRRTAEENAFIAQKQKELADQKDKDKLFQDRLQEEVNKTRQSDLTKSLNDIFGRVEQAGQQKIEEQFIPARRKLISEEAALGRLRSPISIIGLSDLERQKQNAMANLFGNVASARATGELDVAKSLQTILQSQREAEQRASEFGQSLLQRRSELAQARDEAERERTLKRYLGNLDAQTRRPASQDNSDSEILSNILSGVKIAGGLYGQDPFSKGLLPRY